ncbi:hypothetical protein BROC_02322 [Candidatus Brocadiaceae bacterium]|nr:hypothetical protein BROC_02322 [Candidatus Brocadiaceae bacterium]
MTFRNAVYTVAMIVFWLSQPAYAQSESEENRRHCNPTVVQLVGKHFELRDFSYPRDGMYPGVENGGLIVAGVCKAWPTDDSKTIAAFAYDAGVEYEKRLIIALADIPKSRIIASYKGTIPEDAVTEVNDYLLRIDTARYILKRHKSLRAAGKLF